MKKYNLQFFKRKTIDCMTSYRLRPKDQQAYFFLCLFFLKRFLRLCVAILCLFLFFPLGIALMFLMNKLIC